MATRQTSPSSSPVVLAPINSRKRALSEDADSDVPDSKKIKLKSENTPQGKDKDKKKRKKKKKKKTPIVAPLELPIAQPAAVSHSVSVALSPAPTPSKSSMNTAKGKRKAASPSPEPPQVESGDKEAEDSKEPLQLSGPAESPSETIARLTQELGAQSILLKKHESTLVHFNQSLTCQVCLDLLHKPYALAPCGHIACYNCLVAWFTSEPEEQHFGPRKKTCPHCRATVKERPVEVWSIKDMVASLLRSGLVRGLSAGPPELPVLPGPPQPADGPSDPWHNIFRYPHQHPRFHPPALDGPPLSVEDMGMLDAEDGNVYRCLDCMHEIWDGVCTSCHRVYPGHRSQYDDDLDGGMFDDESDEDADAVFWPMPGMAYGGMAPFPLPLPFHGAWWNGEDSDDESHGEHGDGDDGADSFIDDGDESHGPRIIEINDSDSERGSSPPPPRAAPAPRGRRAPRVTFVSSDEEDDEGHRSTRSRREPQSEDEVIVVNDDEIELPRRATRSRSNAQYVSSDEDDASSTASSGHGEARADRRERRLMEILRHMNPGREMDEEDEDQGRTGSEEERGRTDSEEEGYGSDLIVDDYEPW